MNNTILSIQELTKLLNTEDYTFEAPKKHYIKEFEDNNFWTSPKALSLWEDILTRTGKPATPKEYFEEGLRLTKDFWFKDSKEGRLAKYTMVHGKWETTYLTWSEDVEKAVLARLGRMYISFMAEYSAMSIIHTDFPTATILSSNEIDLVLGVDLVVLDNKTKKIIYIHITKDSKYAKSNIEKKGKKVTYLKSRTGKKHYWSRRLNNSHLILLYDLFESNRVVAVNGHHIFGRDYLAKMLNDKFEEDIEKSTEENELQEFHEFLVDNKIKKSGIKKMIIKYTFGD